MSAEVERASWLRVAVPVHSGSQMALSGADIQQTAGLHREGWVIGLHLCLEVTVFLARSSQGSIMTTWSIGQ